METQQKEYSSIEMQLKLAMIHDAFCAYDVDLDKDMAVRELKTLQMETGVDLLAELGMEIPCSYSEFIKVTAGLMPPAERQRYINASDPAYLRAQYRMGNLHPQIEFYLNYQDKKVYYLCQHFYLYRSEESGNLLALIVIEDKTDHWAHIRQLENDVKKGRQRMMARNSFLANISHDIRTPMNAIMGFALLALSHKESEEKTEDYLTKIMSSSTHLLNLLNAIIDIDEGSDGMEGMERKCDIEKLLNDFKEILSPRAEEKRVGLVVDGSRIQNREVYVDKLKLSHVIMNLLDNSIRMTESGGAVALYVTQKQGTREGYMTYEFRVEDTGEGMSREQAAHLFDLPGVDDYTENSFEAEMDLDMSTTKKILDSLEGSVEVETDLGMGTAVIVTLHLRLAEEEKTESEELDLSFLYEDKKTVNFHGKRVLIVEDNDLNREIAEELLEDEGFVVESASDGQKAVEKIQASTEGYYDLVLMDIQMPIMDGYEATWNIRNLKRNDTAFLPVIAMTANTLEEDKQKAFASGMNGHLAKPITVSVLVDTVSEVLATAEYDL